MAQTATRQPEPEPSPSAGCSSRRSSRCSRSSCRCRAWIVDEFYSRDMYPWLQSLDHGVTNLAAVRAARHLLIGSRVAGDALSASGRLLLRRAAARAHRRDVGRRPPADLARRGDRRDRCSTGRGASTIAALPLERDAARRHARRSRPRDMLEAAIVDANALAARLRAGRRERSELELSTQIADRAARRR